jgi:hypothetical protein
LPELNIGNSIFPKLNDSNGIMLCGYEWGWSKEDQRDEERGLLEEFDNDITFTFSNKAIQFGERAFKWRYDKRIINWFDLWGHPLVREGLGSDFDKCILQTNWCNTQNYKIDENYYSKLTRAEQVDNFIFHIKKFRPKLIIFFGSELIKVLQDKRVMPRFHEIMGDITSPLESCQKDFSGRMFYISFQGFEKCNVVCFPHPSSSRGLNDSYIKLFCSELDERIGKVKSLKGIM